MSRLVSAWLAICTLGCAPAPSQPPPAVDLLPRDAAEELAVAARPAGSRETADGLTRLGEVDGRELFFVQDKNAATLRTLIVDRPSGTGAVQPLLEVKFEEGLFGGGQVELVSSPEYTVLVTQIDVPGTGSFTADVVLQWTAGRWMQIEAEKWLSEVQLPPCYGIWKGRRPDLRTMQANSAVWVEGDANCCPTGGEVTVALEIRDRAIHVRSQQPKLVPLDKLQQDPDYAKAIKDCLAAKKG